MAKLKQKAAVSARALLQRINRKLAHEDEVVRTARTESTNVGHFFRVDVRLNAVIDLDVDLEKLGRELEVLSPWEELAEV